MSDTDSFIDEVNEEVRRDRFYFMLKRYGWIAVLAVILLVGGAAWNEYQKRRPAQRRKPLATRCLRHFPLKTQPPALPPLKKSRPQTPAPVPCWAC